MCRIFGSTPPTLDTTHMQTPALASGCQHSKCAFSRICASASPGATHQAFPSWTPSALACANRWYICTSFIETFIADASQRTLCRTCPPRRTTRHSIRCGCTELAQQLLGLSTACSGRAVKLHSKSFISRVCMEEHQLLTPVRLCGRCGAALGLGCDDHSCGHSC